MTETIVGGPFASQCGGAADAMAQPAPDRSEAHLRRRSLSPLLRLWPYLKAHMSDLLFGVFFVAMSSLTALALSGSARVLADDGFSKHTADALLRSFVLAGVIGAAFALSTALRIYYVNKLGERVVVDLRKAVYDHVLGLDLAQVLKVRTGELLSRMTTDMTIVERSLSTAAPVAMRCSLSLSGSLILILLISPGLTGFVLVVLGLGLTPLFLYARKMQRLSVLAQDRFAEAIGYAGEGIEGLETVVAFGQERSMSARFSLSLEQAFAASLRLIGARTVMTGLLIALIVGGVVAILYQCALAVFVNHEMTGGMFLQLLLLSMLAASSARELGEVWGEASKASGALERITELLDREPAIARPARPVRLPRPARGELEFRDVVFAYPGREDAPALNGFSLKVRRGERVALVGPSGAGKSTVFRLLLRFYDPDSGSVHIDGVDLRNADPAEVRSRLAMVSQDPAMFSGSAGENIRFGRNSASAMEITAAAIAAQAASFIAGLPLGFDTPIGERARTLSGGQRQRIAIARAFLKDAPILLLDEATSALDAENERLVQEAIHGAMSGRTSLVIAHRLATVQEADRIIVMDRGQVVEEGCHAELSAQGGLYARLARLQFAVA